MRPSTLFLTNTIPINFVALEMLMRDSAQEKFVDESADKC